MNSCAKYLLYGLCLLFSPSDQEMVCTDEWCCVLAVGIDMKSAATEHEIGNKSVGVNELLMPCSAHNMAYMSL